MKGFLVDTFRNEYLSYEDLVPELNDFELRKFIYYENPKDVFLALIKSLAIGEEAVLLDGDLSDEEIENQGLTIKQVMSGEINKKIEFKDISDLYEKIDKNKIKWSVTIYTSGTTGKPKKVKHSFNSASRAMRMGERFQNDIWLFTYNPTHIAGLQVFSQAFLNRNTIILANEPSKYDIGCLLEDYRVTHISATPTFYRFVLPTLKSEYKKVDRITLGGEKADESIIALLKQKFPKAKITNVYASTEAGNLFASAGEYFKVDQSISDMIRVEDGELLINKKLLGEFNLERDNEWYKTGDLVEFSEGRIRFIQRKSDFINIGGYKVNPAEVEEEIMQMDNIIDVHVYGEDNKMLGKILMADVVLEKVEENINKRIFNHLNNRMQKWKIPRIINIKNEIDKTRTGKKVRNK